MRQSNHIDAFRNAMASAGLSFAGEIIADGTLHRFRPDTDKVGKRNAWYVIHASDDRPAGAFGSWKEGGGKHTWTAKGMKPLTPKDRKRIQADAVERKAQRGVEEAAAQAAAAALAQSMWDDATTATGHPYLTRKGISADGLRKGTWIKDWVKPDGSIKRFETPNTLMVRIRNAKGETTSLQGIFAEPVKMGEDLRDKDFVTGGRKRGCWATIGSPTKVNGQRVVVIVEGYATGASVHAATGLAVVVAFDAGNLTPVAEECRRLMPDAMIVLGADNDQWTDKPVKNPGLTRAGEAAAKVEGLVAFPEFKDLEAKPTDWNDLAALEGREEVNRQIVALVSAAAPTGGAGGARASNAPLSVGTGGAPPASEPGGACGGGETKPKIDIVKGRLGETVAAVDQAMQSSPPAIFQRGGRLVRVAIETAAEEPGPKVAQSARIVELDVHDARLRVAERARCVSYDKNGAPLEADLPKDVASSWLANYGYWGAPPLVGITDVPIVRLVDGSMVNDVGYDAHSRLFYSGACPELAVPERPTRDDALAARDLLLAPYREFPFKGDAGLRAQAKAVVLSYLLTGAIRPFIPLAPITLVSATAPGSGKGLLTEISNLILYGRDAANLPPVAGRGRDDEERKRITSLAKQGAISINFDNCTCEVGSDPLNALLTSDQWTDRILGESNAPTLPARMLVAASGNNLRARGDTVRRALRVELDPGVERPQDRTFEIPNLPAHVRLHRPPLLSAIYTILRAYIRAGRPGATDVVLGRFEEWSSLVAGAVAWLELPNPIESQLQLSEDDPERAQLVAFLAVWHEFFGSEKVTIRIAFERLRIAGANDGCTVAQSNTSEFGEPTQRERARLLWFLFTEIGESAAPDARHVGMYLSRNQNRPADGLIIRRRDDRHEHKAVWSVERTEPSPQ